MMQAPPRKLVAALNYLWGFTQALNIYPKKSISFSITIFNYPRLVQKNRRTNRGRLTEKK